MKISKFTLSIIVVAIAYLIFRFGIRPPIPSSLLYIYLAITVFAILLYISVSKESFDSFLAPIKDVLTKPGLSHIRQPILIMLPIIVTSLSLVEMSGQVTPPVELRSIHPAPPNQIMFREKRLDIMGLQNPLRNDSANFNKYVEEGATIYFKNCFFCHGDNLDGKGHFAQALNPMPANFVDKGTIAQLQESFVFWRISKGGPGLPNEGKPWNSSMPAWEDILTEEEIWKVIMYIYDAAGVEPRTWEEQSESIDHNTDSGKVSKNGEGDGSSIYLKKCQYCHGVKGKGDGPAAERLNPRPRDLTKARYKIKSTPGGELPTDKDIFDIISNGIRGTSMPAWTTLSNDERWKLVTHVKSLAKRFRKSKERGKPEPVPVKVGVPVQSTDESIKKGKALFKKLDCWKCHGENGYGNGPNALELKDDWQQPIRPANLAIYWNFKGGYSVEDIYKTITTGRAGTPMPSFLDSASDEERWHLANYVKTIGSGPIPAKEPILKSHFVSGQLPETADDKKWDNIKGNQFSLFGQIMVPPKLYTPSIEAVYVKSVFNNDSISFLLEWDDISENKSSSESDEKKFLDAAAIQFPVALPETSASTRPYFLMGDKNSGVNLWRWKSNKGFKEINCSGIKNQKTQKAVDLNGDVVYYDGRYRLCINRSLLTEDSDKDIQFEVNRFIPISFFIWDGENGDVDTKMSLSTWSNLFLEKKETGEKATYAIIIGLFVVALEVFVLWRVRNN